MKQNKSTFYKLREGSRVESLESLESLDLGGTVGDVSLFITT